MTREQIEALEQARERLVEIAYRDEAKAVLVRADDLRVVLRALSAPKAEDSTLSASVDESLASLRATANNPSGKWEGASKLAAPKAEAVKGGVLGWRRDWCAGEDEPCAPQFTDSPSLAEQWETHPQTDKVIPLYASPVPALTDEAVERALVSWCGEENWHESQTSTAIEIMRKHMRAALLAAFPSKGEGG